MPIELLSKALGKRDYENKLHHIPLSAIQLNPSPIRKGFSEMAIHELSESIYHIGLLHPILIKEVRDHYEIVSGERRFKAFQLLNESHPNDFNEIPSMIVDSKMDTRVFSLTENIQREPLSILEECEAIYSLIETIKDTYGGIGKLLGKSNDYIENRMRYLRIHKALKSRITSFDPPDTFYEGFNRLALSKVLALKPLLSHWSAEECYECLVEIVEGDLSLREIKAKLCDHQEKRMERKPVDSSQMGSRSGSVLEKPVESKKIPEEMPIGNRLRGENQPAYGGLSPQIMVNQRNKSHGVDEDFWPSILKHIQKGFNVKIIEKDLFQKALSDLIHQYGVSQHA